MFQWLFLTLTLLSTQIITSADEKVILSNGAVAILRTAGMVLSQCRRNTDGGDMQKCLEGTLLRATDRLLDRDVFELPYGLRLIRDEPQKVYNTTRSIKEMPLMSAIADRFVNVLRTHSLQIPLPNLTDIVEGRRRHHRHGKNDMMGLMVFGVMASSVIAIPLGFQFLAVLGGKALMLAKLALILTSIQGLKRIATSNVGYGLYSAGPSTISRPWLYDRRWQGASLPIDAGHGGGGGGGLLDGSFDVPPEGTHHLHGLDRARILLPRVDAPEHHHQYHNQEH